LSSVWQVLARARTSSCDAALAEACGAKKSDVFACAECAGAHQQTLKAKGCGSDAIAAWCAGVPLRTDDDAAGALSCSSPELRHFPYCDPSLPLDDRVEDLVKRMSLSEKIGSMRMTNDDSPMNTSGVPRLGVPPLFISECLHGVGEGGNDMCSGGACPTAFPSPAALGCSFNRSQWFEIGTAVGREARALRNEGKAAGLVCWAPVVNLVRVSPVGTTAAPLRVHSLSNGGRIIARILAGAVRTSRHPRTR